MEKAFQVLNGTIVTAHMLKAVHLQPYPQIQLLANGSSNNYCFPIVILPLFNNKILILSTLMNPDTGLDFLASLAVTCYHVTKFRPMIQNQNGI